MHNITPNLGAGAAPLVGFNLVPRGRADSQIARPRCGCRALDPGALAPRSTGKVGIRDRTTGVFDCLDSHVSIFMLARLLPRAMV